MHCGIVTRGFISPLFFVPYQRITKVYHECYPLSQYQHPLSTANSQRVWTWRVYYNRGWNTVMISSAQTVSWKLVPAKTQNFFTRQQSMCQPELASMSHSGHVLHPDLAANSQGADGFLSSILNVLFTLVKARERSRLRRRRTQQPFCM